MTRTTGHRDTHSSQLQRAQPSRLARSAQRLVLRTGRGPLRGLWSLLYELVIRGVAAYLIRADNRVAVYVKGTLAIDEPLYGLSDIDMIVVTPESTSVEHPPAQQVKERWRRLLRVCRPLGHLVYLFVYEESDLRVAASAPSPTFDLADDSGRGAFLGIAPLVDELGLQERPGLSGPTSDWRRVAGPDRRTTDPPRGAQDERIAAWLELQFWSRYLFAACVRPDQPHIAYLCVKLLAEPARILLKVVHDEELVVRTEVLERARCLFPEEEESLARALELHRALPSEPEAPLEETLAAFIRLTARVGREFGRHVEQAGTTEVALIWGDQSELVVPEGADSNLRDLVGPVPLLPLADWRALVVPPPPDETFALVRGDPTSPAFVGALAGVGNAGTYPAIRSDGILVLPATSAPRHSGAGNPQERSADWARVKLRGVQCTCTDPVSFALIEERPSASFPDLRGWSARDVARRAVAEHRAWLNLPLDRPAPRVRGWINSQQPSSAPSVASLGRLLTAIRAGFFLESVESGSAELALTVAATADALANQRAGARSLADEAVSAYRRSLVEDVPPTPKLLATLRKFVLELPAYAEPSRRSRQGRS